jgi:hypothetical protein
MHKIPPGSSENAQNPMRDFVHFWKFLVGFCAFLEFPHGKAYTCPFHPFTFSLQNTCFCNKGTSTNAQHYMRNLQKCKASHEEIPNMHKIRKSTKSHD